MFNAKRRGCVAFQDFSAIDHFSYSIKESASNDFKQFSNVHNTVVIKVLTPFSRTTEIKVYKDNARSKFFDE